jgi:radical SAM-linked protein
MTMRIRITFLKAGPMQYVGHLDLHKSWERTFRRSRLPLDYSQGFHPQPHLNLACALPVGFTSQCELLDAWLEQDLPLIQISEAIREAIPPGMEILGLERVDLHAPALQTQVLSAVYDIYFLDDIPDLDERLHRLMAAEHLPRVRRNKPYDLRPLIEDAVLVSQDDIDRLKLHVELAARDGATGRPEEMLAEMGVSFQDTHIHREALKLSRD